MSMLKTLERQLKQVPAAHISGVESVLSRLAADIHAEVEKEFEAKCKAMRDEMLAAKAEKDRVLSAEAVLSSARDRAETQCSVLKERLAECKTEMEAHKKESEEMHEKHKEKMKEREEKISELSVELAGCKAKCESLVIELEHFKKIMENISHQKQMPAVAPVINPVLPSKQPVITYEVKYDSFGRVSSVVSKPVKE